MEIKLTEYEKEMLQNLTRYDHMDESLAIGIIYHSSELMKNDRISISVSGLSEEEKEKLEDLVMDMLDSWDRDHHRIKYSTVQKIKIPDDIKEENSKLKKEPKSPKVASKKPVEIKKENNKLKKENKSPKVASKKPIEMAVSTK